MTRLSSMLNDYSNVGTITDRRQIIALGGENSFTLSFIEGSEEVYLNGSRLAKGPTLGYTTSTGFIKLNSELSEGDELILIGRSSYNSIDYSRSNNEYVTLEDGQSEVIFSGINTNSIEVYIYNPMSGRGKLSSSLDYTIRVDSSNIIDLIDTFPEGTILEGVENRRQEWLDANNLVVNDGTISKSLSFRFRDTQESYNYFIETNGVQLQGIHVGLELKKWSVDAVTGVAVEDASGNYPTLKVGKSYWIPSSIPSEGLIVNNWNISGNTLNISSTIGTSVSYTRRIVT